jgi:hypothetical protein
VPNRSEHAYEYDEHQVLAVTFNRFITTHFEPPDLDWSAIDGRWLQHAFESDTGETSLYLHGFPRRRSRAFVPQPIPLRGLIGWGTKPGTARLG